MKSGVSPAGSRTGASASPARRQCRSPGPLPAGEHRIACRLAEAAAAAALEPIAVPPAQAGGRTRRAAFARQVAMYLAHVGLGVPMGEIGRAFGRDRTTVTHACHVIEDRRDDQGFDALLDRLEAAVTALREARALGRRD